MRELLGTSFDLRFEESTSRARASNAEAAGDFRARSYAEIPTLAAHLAEHRRQAFLYDRSASWKRYPTELRGNEPRLHLPGLRR